jgi:HEPN domain-containing protein
MNRRDFQVLAEVRIREALVLLENQCYQGAYYLAGYAVECALKACKAKNTDQYDFPPDRNTVNRIYSHNFNWLLQEAELEEAHEIETSTDSQFAVNCHQVIEWNEGTRYRPSILQNDAEEMTLAVADKDHGVLAGLRELW